MAKRIGLLGCGVVADYGHSWAISQTDGLELAALCDPNPAALGLLSARFPHAGAFTDPAEFFASGLDAVSICTPAPLHHEHALMAARQGVHILCEKPLAQTDAQIREMIAAAERADVLLATALCYRFSPVAQTIHRLVREGAIGEVRALRLVYLWNLHGKWTLDEQGNRFESPRRIGRFEEGGPLVDCGVHQLDLALWWTGRDVVAQTASAAWIEDHETPGHIWAHFDMEGGIHTLVEVSFSYCQTALEPRDTFTYELLGTDGMIRYERDGWRFEVRNSRGTQILPGASEKDFHRMYAAWRDCLYAGELVHGMPSAHEGLKLTQLARRATEEAMARGKEIVRR